MSPPYDPRVARLRDRARSTVESDAAVVEKILYVNEALGGIARIDFQMTNAARSHSTMLHGIELLGTQVAPAVRKAPGV